MSKDGKKSKVLRCEICGERISLESDYCVVTYKKKMIVICENENEMVAAFIVNIMALGSLFQKKKENLMTDRDDNGGEGVFM